MNTQAREEFARHDVVSGLLDVVRADGERMAKLETRLSHLEGKLEGVAETTKLRIDTLEKRVAELEKSKLNPFAIAGTINPYPVSGPIGAVCPNCGHSVLACKCPSLRSEP